MKQLKFFKFLFVAACIILVAFSCKKSGSVEKEEEPVIEKEEPVTPADKLTFGNGVNLQPSYANNGSVNFAWDLMKSKTKIKTVRIEIEPDKVNQGKIWIQQALENGYKVIATYHKYTVLGSDNVSELIKAANWWKDNYKNLSPSGEVIINLMNEWGSHSITPKEYAIAYNNAITIVRDVYKGKIIIDCPGYGQGTAVMSVAIGGSDGVKINDTNIILSVHVYPNGWNQIKNRDIQASDLDDLSSTGRACIIGEFGNQPANGNADWAGIVNYAKSKGWPVIGWCWNGDGGVMNMVSPNWYQDPNATSYSITAYFNTIYQLL